MISDTIHHPIIQRFFQHRSMDLPAIHEFFSWDLKELPTLFASLIDMDKAAQRITVAIQAGETIGIYGDYDVDGTTSCALFYRFFQLLSSSSQQQGPISTRLYQPSRFREGYGLHLCSIDQALADGVSLLLTVDCGITNEEAAHHAKQKGLDLIITDHHKDGAPEQPVAMAILNPNRRDEACEPSLQDLAGVGVAFALCVRIREILKDSGQSCPRLYSLLPFVAIGTICDMVPLSSINRKLVRHGLHALRETHYEGLKQLFPPAERAKKPIASESLSFRVGPLINAKGRLDHPQRALELLTTDNPNTAFQTHNHLKDCNKERKEIQATVFDQAKEQILSQMYGGEHIISIAYAPHWHEGVVGIVAAKLVETFKAPAIVLCRPNQKEKLLKGSARTAGPFNIYEGLAQCADLFTKFGGHRAAAGLSMPEENLKQFSSRLRQTMSSLPPNQRTQEDHYDLTLSFDDITPELALGLEWLEPFGNGNQKPIFQMNDATLQSFQVLKETHIRWTFTSSTPNKNQGKTLQGISFFFVGRWGAPSLEELRAKRGETLNIRFTLGFNHFRGNKFVQLQVLDIS